MFALTGFSISVHIFCLSLDDTEQHVLAVDCVLSVHSVLVPLNLRGGFSF